MGTDTRYLVVTLIAVFVALSVGILVGVGITNSPSLEKLSKRIKQDFETVRRENADLRFERDKSQEEYHAAQRLIKNVLPSLVQGKLQGQAVAIMITGELPDISFLDEMTHAIELAGGRVQSVTRFKAGFTAMSTSELIDCEKSLGLKPVAADVLPKTIAIDLAQKIVSGQSEAALLAMRKSKWLDLSGSYHSSVQKVILVGGRISPKSGKKAARKETSTTTSSETEWADSIDVPMIELLQSLKVPVIGTEPSNVTTSYIDTYQSREIPTVDNVDTEVGQVALVYALAGEAGNYGTKSTADRLLPTLQVSPMK